MFVLLLLWFLIPIYSKKTTPKPRKECYRLGRAVVTQYSIWLSKYKWQVTCKYFGPLPFSQLITVSRFIVRGNYSGCVVRVEPCGAVMMCQYVLKQLLPGACTQWVGLSDLLVCLSGYSKVSGNERGTIFRS